MNISDPIADMQGLWAAQRFTVQVRAVRGAKVLQHHHIPLRDEARMPRRRESVFEADVRLIATTEHRAVAQIIGGAGRKARSGADAQLRRAALGGGRGSQSC